MSLCNLHCVCSIDMLPLRATMNMRSGYRSSARLETADVQRQYHTTLMYDQCCKIRNTTISSPSHSLELHSTHYRSIAVQRHNRAFSLHGVRSVRNGLQD